MREFIEDNDDNDMKDSDDMLMIINMKDGDKLFFFNHITFRKFYANLNNYTPTNKKKLKTEGPTRDGAVLLSKLETGGAGFKPDCACRPSRSEF